MNKFILLFLIAISFSSNLQAIYKINEKNFEIKKIFYENKLKNKILKLELKKNIIKNSSKVVVGIMNIVEKEKSYKRLVNYKKIEFFSKLTLLVNKKTKRIKYLESNDFNAMYIKKYHTYHIQIQNGKSIFVSVSDLINKKNKIRLTNPLKEVKRISSKFGMRKHPITKRRLIHNGIDLVNKAGTKIYASAPGKLYRRGYDKRSGNYIILKHMNGVQTTYLHLKSFNKKITKRSKVTRNTVIGYLGNTGRSTGPHLHFGVKIKGNYINPEKYISFNGNKTSNYSNHKFKNNKKLKRAIKKRVKKIKKFIRK